MKLMNQAAKYGGFIHSKPRYTIGDLEQLLSIGRATIYQAIRDGKLKTYTLGERKSKDGTVKAGRRFASPAAVDEYVALCEKEADQAA
jgi:hypothetical protein